MVLLSESGKPQAGCGAWKTDGARRDVPSRGPGKGGREHELHAGSDANSKVTLAGGSLSRRVSLPPCNSRKGGRSHVSRGGWKENATPSIAP